MRWIARASFVFVLMLCITACSAAKPSVEAPSSVKAYIFDGRFPSKQEDFLSDISKETGENNSISAEGIDSEKETVEKMLEYAFSGNEEIADLLNSKAYKYKCNISLINICGDDFPEMVLSFRTADDVESEYIYAADESGAPVCMAEFMPLTELDGLYIDPADNTYYIICCGSHPPKDDLYWTIIKKLELPMESKVSPDFAEYKNGDAFSFMENTHMYFIRYDDEDWDDPDAGAAMFYCEDSGLFEAYSVSKQVLELTSTKISDYTNQDGNHIYSYLPGENYLVSRREYEKIKTRTFEILTEAADEPEISSGWIDIEDVDKWLDSLA